MSEEQQKKPIWFHKDAEGKPTRRWPTGRVRYRGKLTWPDGKRQDIGVPEKHCYTEERAVEYVLHKQEEVAAEGAQAWSEEQARRDGEKATKPVDTAAMDRWVDDWLDAKKARGQTSTADRKGHYDNHIKKALDGKHVRDWTSDDMRTLVAYLDGKIAAEELAPKSARNIWGTATKMCADACKSKVAALRVRTENPTKDVEGPEHGDERGKQFLYPNELVQLVACEDVPQRWRRAIALAVYLYPRAGELRALDWSDVDLEHGTIHIHSSFERRSRKVKTTKSGKGRRIPIEPAVMPLLRAMHDEADGKGPVCPIPNRMADRLREWLATAKLTRRELTDETSKTTRPLAWHDLRATGTTWMAVRGDEAMKIMQRAGHRDIATTMIYVRTAEAMGPSFGEPFPPLPAALLSTPDVYTIEKANKIRAGHGIRKRTGSPDTSIAAEKRTSAPPIVEVRDESTTPNVPERRDVDNVVDTVERALVAALSEASRAGRWDTVAVIARELDARRRSRFTFLQGGTLARSTRVGHK